MILTNSYFKDSICIFLFDLYCKCLSANALYFSPRDDINVFWVSNSAFKIYTVQINTRQI